MLLIANRHYLALFSSSHHRACGRLDSFSSPQLEPVPLDFILISRHRACEVLDLLSSPHHRASARIDLFSSPQQRTCTVLFAFNFLSPTQSLCSTWFYSPLPTTEPLQYLTYSPLFTTEPVLNLTFSLKGPVLDLTFSLIYSPQSLCLTWLYFTFLNTGSVQL